MTAGDVKFSDAMSWSVVFCRSSSASMRSNNCVSRCGGQGMGKHSSKAIGRSDVGRSGETAGHGLALDDIADPV